MLEHFGIDGVFEILPPLHLGHDQLHEAFLLLLVHTDCSFEYGKAVDEFLQLLRGQLRQRGGSGRGGRLLEPSTGLLVFARPGAVRQRRGQVVVQRRDPEPWDL